MKKILDRMTAVEEKITILHVDMVWIKRIVIGAAGLGFIEKCISWFVKGS